MSQERRSLDFELNLDTSKMLTELQGASDKMQAFTNKVNDANEALAQQGRDREAGNTVTPLTDEQLFTSSTGIFKDEGALAMYRSMASAVSGLAKNFESLLNISPNAAESLTKPFYEVRSLVGELQSSLRTLHFDTTGMMPDELFNKMNYMQSRMRALTEDMKTYQESLSSMSAETLKVWENQSIRKGLQERASSYARSLKNDNLTRDLDTLVAAAIEHSPIGHQLTQLGVAERAEQEKVLRMAFTSGMNRTDRLNHGVYHTGEVRGLKTTNYLFDRVPEKFAYAFMNEGQLPKNFEKPTTRNTQAQRVETYKALQKAVKDGNYSAFEFAREAGLIHTTNGNGRIISGRGSRMTWLDESKVTDEQLDYVALLAAVEAKHALESMPMYHKSVKKREDLDALLRKDNKGFESAYEVMALDTRSVVLPYYARQNAALRKRKEASEKGWYTGEEVSVPKLKLRDLISIPQVTLSKNGEYFVNVNDRENPFGAVNYAFSKNPREGLIASEKDEWVTTGRSPIIDALFALKQKNGKPERKFVNRTFGYGFDKEGNAIQGEPIVMQVLVDDLFEKDQNGKVLFDIEDNDNPILSKTKIETSKNGVYKGEELTRSEMLDRLVSRQATIRMRKIDENGNEIIPKTQKEKDEMSWGVLFTNATGGRARFTVAKMSDIKALDAEDDRRGLVRRTQFFNEMFYDKNGALRILGVDDADIDSAYAKYFDAARKMDSDSVPLEEIGGITPKVASVNFKAYYDYMDKLQGIKKDSEASKSRRFDGGQFHMPWVADRDFQGRLGMTKFYSIKGDFKKFFEQGGGTYEDYNGVKHAYLPGVGTADAEDYEAYLKFLSQITERQVKINPKTKKPIINPETGLPEEEAVAKLKAGLTRNTALTPIQVKDGKGKLVDRYGDIKTYGDLMDWVNAKFIDTMQGDVGVLASGDTVAKSFTRNAQITLENYRSFFQPNGRTVSTDPNKWVNPTLYDAKTGKFIDRNEKGELIDPSKVLVTLTPQQQTDYLFANTQYDRGFSMRMMKESLNYNKQKDFLNPALGSAIVVTEQMVKQSLSNYKSELAALDDPSEVIKRLFSSNDSLSRIVAKNPLAIYSDPAVRERIEERRNELQENIAKGYLYLPGIQESFGVSASMYDALGGWIKNVTGKNTLFGTAEDLKLLTARENKARGNGVTGEMYARTRDEGDTFLATRSPYAIGASLRVKNIFSRRYADEQRREKFEKAMKEYSVSGDSAIFNVEDFYKLNTGDFDGDLAFLLSNDPVKYGSYIELTSRQNDRVSKLMEDLQRREEQARNITGDVERTQTPSFSAFVKRYARAGRKMGAAYLVGQAGRVLVPGVDKVTQSQLEEVQALGNILYSIAADQPKHTDIEDMTASGEAYAAAMRAGKPADRTIKELLEIWNKPEEQRDFSDFDILKHRMPTFKDQIGIHMLEGARIARSMDPSAFAEIEKAFDASLAQYADEPEAVQKAYKWYTNVFKERVTGQWQLMSGTRLGEGLNLITQLRALQNQAEIEANNETLSDEDRAIAQKKYEHYRDVARRFERRVGEETSKGMTRTSAKNRDELKDYYPSWTSDDERDNSEFQKTKTAADRLYQERLMTGDLTQSEVRADKRSQEMNRLYNKRRIIAQNMTSYNWSTASQFMNPFNKPIEHEVWGENLATGEKNVHSIESYSGPDETSTRSKHYLESTIRSILTGKNTTDPDALIGSLAHGMLDQYVAGRSEYLSTVVGDIDNELAHKSGRERSETKLLESLKLFAGVLPASHDAELLENMKAAGVGFKLTAEGKAKVKNNKADQLTVQDFAMYQNLNAGQNSQIWRESYDRAAKRFEAIQSGQLDPLLDKFLKPIFDENRVIMAEGTFYDANGRPIRAGQSSHGIPVTPEAKQVGGMFRLYQDENGLEERPLSFRFTPDLVTWDEGNNSRTGGISVIDYKSSLGSGKKGRIQAEFYAHLLEEKGKQAWNNKGDTDLSPYKIFVTEEGLSRIGSTRIVDMFGETTNGNPFVYKANYTQEQGQQAFDLVEAAWKNLTLAARKGFVNQLGLDKIKESDLAMGNNRKIDLNRLNWFLGGTKDKLEGYNFNIDEDYNKIISFLAENDENFRSAVEGSDLINTPVKQKVYEALSSPKMAPNKEYLTQKLAQAENVLGDASSLVYKTSGTRFSSIDKYTRTIQDLEKLYTENDIKAINAYGDENLTELAPDVAMMIKDSAENIEKRRGLIEKLKLNAITNLSKDKIRAQSTIDQLAASKDPFEAYTATQSLIESLVSQNEFWKSDTTTYNGKFIEDEETLYGPELWSRMKIREKEDAEAPLVAARERARVADNARLTRKQRAIRKKKGYGTFVPDETWTEEDHNAWQELEDKKNLEPYKVEHSFEYTDEEKKRIERIGNEADKFIKSGKTAKEQYELNLADIQALRERANKNFIQASGNAVRGLAISTDQLLFGQDTNLSQFEQRDLVESKRIGELLTGRASVEKMNDSIRDLLAKTVRDPNTNKLIPEIQGDLRTKLEAYSATLKEKIEAINAAMTKVPESVAQDVQDKIVNKKMKEAISSLRRGEQIFGIDSAVSDRVSSVFDLLQQKQEIRQKGRRQQEKIDTIDNVDIPAIQQRITELQASKKGKTKKKQAEIDAQIQDEVEKLQGYNVSRPEHVAELKRLMGIDRELDFQIGEKVNDIRKASESDIVEMMAKGEKRVINPYGRPYYDAAFQESVERRRIDRDRLRNEEDLHAGRINIEEYNNRVEQLNKRESDLDNGLFMPRSSRDFEIAEKIESEQERIRRDRAKAAEMLSNEHVTQGQFDILSESLDRQEESIANGNFEKRLRQEYINDVNAERIRSRQSQNAFLTEYNGQPLDADTIATTKANDFYQKVQNRKTELTGLLEGITGDTEENRNLRNQYQTELHALEGMKLSTILGNFRGQATAEENLREMSLDRQRTNIERTFAVSHPLSLQDTLHDAIESANRQIEQYIKDAGLDETKANEYKAKHNLTNIIRDTTEAYQRRLEEERFEELKKSTSFRELATGRKASSHQQADMAVEALRIDVNKHVENLRKRAITAEENKDIAERDRLLAEAADFESLGYEDYKRRTFERIEFDKEQTRIENEKRNRGYNDIASNARINRDERVNRRMQDLRNNIQAQMHKMDQDFLAGVYDGREQEYYDQRSALYRYDYGSARSRFAAEEHAADISFEAANSSREIKTASTLENRLLTRDETTSANYARLIQEREDYIKSQLEAKRMNETQAIAYRNRYSEPYLLGIAQQQTDYTFGQRELANAMNSRQLEATLSGRAMTSAETVEQRYDTLRKKRDEELERIRKENGWDQATTESYLQNMHPEWQDPNLHALAERQVQQAQEETTLHAMNMFSATQDQNAARMRQMEYSQQQFQRQRQRRFATSRLAQNLFALSDRRISLEQGISSREDAIRQSNRNISSYEQTLRKGNLSELERTKVQGQLDAEREKVRGYNNEIARSQEEIASLRSPTAVLGETFKTAGQSVAMLAQRLGRKLFMKAIAEAKKFVVEFNRSMTTIQMITLKTDDQMSKLGDGLIAKAKDLKISISEITKSAEILYRQGLSDKEVNERLDVIAKFSKVSGTKTEAATKLITVAMNTGLVTSPQEAADIVTALGDNAATNAAEIEKGIEKAGAAAAADGTTFGQLAAMLTAITSTTQIGGNVAGRTLNTIFGRMNKIGTNELIYDENGHAVSGSAVAKLLEKQGIKMYDENGNKRSSYDILYALSQKWDKMSDAEQQQMANAIAGTRQYSNFSAIMQGMSEGKVDEYMALIGDSTGITNQKYEIYANSLQAALDTLKNTFDELVHTLTKGGFLQETLSVITQMVKGITNLSKGVGGLGAAIVTILPLMAGLALLKASLYAGKAGIPMAIAGAALVIGGSITASIAGSNQSATERYEKALDSAEQQNQQIDTDLDKLKTLRNKENKTDTEKQEYAELVYKYSREFGLLEDTSMNAADAIGKLKDSIDELDSSADEKADEILASDQKRREQEAYNLTYGVINDLPEVLKEKSAEAIRSDSESFLPGMMDSYLATKVYTTDANGNISYRNSFDMWDTVADGIASPDLKALRRHMAHELFDLAQLGAFDGTQYEDFAKNFKSEDEWYKFVAETMYRNHRELIPIFEIGAEFRTKTGNAALADDKYTEMVRSVLDESITPLLSDFKEEEKTYLIDQAVEGIKTGKYKSYDEAVASIFAPGSTRAEQTAPARALLLQREEKGEIKKTLLSSQIEKPTRKYDYYTDKNGNIYTYDELREMEINSKIDAIREYNRKTKENNIINAYITGGYAAAYYDKHKGEGAKPFEELNESEKRTIAESAFYAEDEQTRIDMMNNLDWFNENLIGGINATDDELRELIESENEILLKAADELNEATNRINSQNYELKTDIFTESSERAYETWKEKNQHLLSSDALIGAINNGEYTSYKDFAEAVKQDPYLSLAWQNAVEKNDKLAILAASEKRDEDGNIIAGPSMTDVKNALMDTSYSYAKEESNIYQKGNAASYGLLQLTGDNVYFSEEDRAADLDKEYEEYKENTQQMRDTTNEYYDSAIEQAKIEFAHDEQSYKKRVQEIEKAREQSLANITEVDRETFERQNFTQRNRNILSTESVNALKEILPPHLFNRLRESSIQGGKKLTAEEEEEINRRISKAQSGIQGYTVSEGREIAKNIINANNRNSYLSSLDSAAIQAAQQASPSLQKYLALDEEKRKSEYGETLLIQAEIEIGSHTDIKELEEVGLITAGIASDLDTIQKYKNMSIAVKTEMKLQKESRGSGQLYAQLYSTSQSQVDQAAMSILDIDASMYYSDPSRYLFEARELARKQRIEKQNEFETRLQYADIREIAEIRKEVEAYGPNSTISNITELPEEYKVDNSGRVYSIDENGNVVFNDSYTDEYKRGYIVHLHSDLDNQDYFAGKERKYSEFQLAEARRRMLSGENLKDVDYDLYLAASSSMGDNGYEYFRQKYDADNRNGKQPSQDLLDRANYEEAEKRRSLVQSSYSGLADIQRASVAINSGSNTEANRKLIASVLELDENQVKGLMQQEGRTELKKRLSDVSKNLVSGIVYNLESTFDGLDLGNPQDTQQLLAILKEKAKTADDAMRDMLNMYIDILEGIPELASVSDVYKDAQIGFQNAKEKRDQYDWLKENISTINEMETGQVVVERQPFDHEIKKEITFADNLQAASENNQQLGEILNEHPELVAAAEAYHTGTLDQNGFNAIVDYAQYGTVTPQLTSSLMTTLFGGSDLINDQGLFNIPADMTSDQLQERFSEIRKSGEGMSEMLDILFKQYPDLQKFLETGDQRVLDKALKSINNEITDSKIADIVKYSKGVEGLGDILTGYARGGNDAARASTRLDASMKNLSNKKFALSQASGKTGEQLYQAGQNGQDKTFSYLAKMFPEYDESEIRAMSQEQIQHLVDIAGPILDEEFSGTVDALYAMLPESVVNIPLGDLVRINADGSIDLTDVDNVLDDTSEQIILAVMSLARDYGGVDLEAILHDKSVDIKGLFRAAGGSGIRTPSKYSGKSSGGGGGGKSEADKLLEKHKHETAALEHENKMLDIQKKHQDMMNDYSGYNRTLDEQINLQGRLRSAYASQISELEALRARTEANSDDWWKLTDAIYAAREAMASVANTIEELNAERIDILSQKQENEDKPDSHADSMLQKMAARYQTTGDFANYEAISRKQIDLYSTQIDLNNKQIKEQEDLLAKFVEGSDSWIEVRDKIWAIKEENAELENQILSGEIELDRARLTQLTTEFEQATSPLDHMNNMLSTYGGMYQNVQDYTGYQNTLREQNSANTGKLGEVRKTIDLIREQMYTLKEGSVAWFEARDALYQYEEMEAQLNATILENNQAIGESKVSALNDELTESTKHLNHELAMIQEAGSEFQKEGDLANYQKTIRDSIDVTTESITAQNKVLAKMRDALNDPEITDSAYKTLVEQIESTEEAVQKTTNSLKDLNREANKVALEVLTEAFNYGGEGYTIGDNEMQHNIQMYQYQETKYQNRKELTNYGIILSAENELQKERAANITTYIDKLKDQKEAIVDDEDAIKQIDESIYKWEEELEKVNNTIEKNEDALKKNAVQVLKTRQAVENQIDQEIRNRIQEEKERLAATINVENTIIETIRKNYREQWNLEKKTIQKKKEALNEEKSLLNQRLQARKNAIQTEEKLEEIARLKQQLAIIQADSNRTKEAKELTKQIANLEKEMAWQIADEQAAATSQMIDDQIKAYDDYITTHEEDLNEYLENTANFREKLDEILNGSVQDFLDFMHENSEDYKNATVEMQRQMDEGWTETFRKAKGELDLYWSEVEENMRSREGFIEYMKESTTYAKASETGKQILEADWGEMYDAFVSAYKSDAEYEHSHDDTYNTIQEMKDWNYKISFATEKETILDLQHVLHDIYDVVRNKVTDYNPYDNYEGVGYVAPPPAPSSGGGGGSASGSGSGSGGGTGGGSASSNFVNWANSSTGNLLSGFTTYDVVANSNGAYGIVEVRGINGRFSTRDAAQAYADEMNLFTLSQKLEDSGFDGTDAANAAEGVLALVRARTKTKEQNYSKYAEGGLVDYTGLAWVDGTTTRPESFLDATDTKLLRSMLDAYKYVNTPYMSYIDTSKYGNDISFGDVNVTINEAKIDNDQDVAELAKKIGTAFTKELTKSGLNNSAYAW